ncbi:MAG: crotonase/enoyl-CoA hydratase family protein [Rhodobacteraceae bacterium]|nr:crotonase/enoyl-CoA hydratase family protein [Paracoccaceae bacterium]
MTDRITTKITDHIAEVRLNRPEKKNALDLALFDELAAAGEALKTQPSLRAVVLTGEGDTFCAGIDTSSFMEIAGRIDQVRAEMLDPPGGGVANRFQKPCTVWQALQVPVIAAIEGVAFGAGMQLALAADFRIAAPDARFSIMEAKWGLIPDMGISQSLPKLLPADRAKELIMTGRVLSADAALSLGLITRIEDDPLAAAHVFATELASKSPDAVQASKKLVEGCWGCGPEGLKLEAELQAPIIGAPNQIEAVMAGMQKREAKFK